MYSSDPAGGSPQTVRDVLLSGQQISVSIGTGGTFTTLAAMVKEIPWTARTHMHGTRVTEKEIREVGEKLADMPLEERFRLPGLQPGRADIVVHGICILLAVMKRFGIESITVSEWGNMDGYLWKKLM